MFLDIILFFSIIGYALAEFAQLSIEEVKEEVTRHHKSFTECQAMIDECLFENEVSIVYLSGIIQ